MIIARAPVRISFAGGGTDLPSYYMRNGGMVVSAAIAKYFYVHLNADGRTKLQITSSDYHTFYRHSEDVELMWDGDLALPKAVLHQFGITHGVSMFLASEIPPGTGLGSSSTVAVAITKALSTLLGDRLSKHDIAELASYIEIEKLCMPIGRQDQYASAFGGVNLISFAADGVHVQPIEMSDSTLRRLEENTMLFFTGSSRNSASILKEQNKSSEGTSGRVVESLHAIKAMALEAKECLETGDLTGFGQLLHRGWEFKKSLASGISNPHIDDCYAAALKAGAAGGKITGAGGGGFLLLYCEGDSQDKVTQALEEKGLTRMDFNFDFGGAKVLMNASMRMEWIGHLSLPWVEERSA